jgi:signal transduction histidine kinase
MMAMMNDRVTPVRNNQLLNLTVYLTLIIMASIGLTTLPDVLMKVAATAVCLVFGLVHRFGFPAAITLRRASIYFAVQTILVTALIVVSRRSDPFNFPFFILGIQAMLILSNRAGLAWIALFYLLSSGSALWLRGASSLTSILFNAAAFFVVGVYGYTMRQSEFARRHNQQLLEELRAAQQQLQDLAVTEERNRLARDLHDSAKQQAFALSAQLDAVHSLIHRDPSTAERHLVQAEQLADTLRQELATLILELRPSAFGNAGLATALRQYVADWSQQSAINVVVHVQDERVLPREVEHTLFRIAQEALANVARHSQAHRVDVRLDYTPDRLSLTIQDDGQGFDPQQITAGVGTHSMHERAAMLPRGALTLETAHGRGTRMTVQCQI